MWNEDVNVFLINFSICHINLNVYIRILKDSLFENSLLVLKLEIVGGNKKTKGVDDLALNKCG